MKMINHWVIISIFLLSAPLMAAEIDRKAPVFIEASKVLVDEPNGVSTYSGNVLFQQGGMSLRAEKISVFSEQRSLHRIEAEGSPVLFEIKNDNGNTIRAEAKNMRYQMSDGRLLMEGEAQLWQEGNHFSGGRIEFDIYKNRILASHQGRDQQRVRVVIQPEVLYKDVSPVNEGGAGE